MGSSETPTQITFTDVSDVLNSVIANFTSSGYSVTVPNGHSYNIRVDYSYQYVQYQYECDSSYGAGQCQNSSNTDCVYDYTAYTPYDHSVYTCTHYGNVTGMCTGGQIRVNVSADRMSFDIQCRQS